MLIAGGLLVDGTGAEPTHADVLIDGDRIVAVGPELDAPPGVEVLDASGRLVTPGFIDIHTHSDVSLHLDGRGESKLRQGVTTEVIGNCGFSPYPLTTGARRDQLDLLEGIGDPRIDPDWTDLEGYAAALTEAGIAVNVASLVGHGALRLAVAGTSDRSLGAAELTAACALLDTQLSQGAFGMSTGLTYVPSRFADRDELMGFSEVLAAHGALYATHARGEAATSIREAAELSLGTGVRVQYSHLAINDPARWGGAQHVIDLIAEQRAAGADIAADVYPYAASASALTQYLPVWIQDGGIDAMRLRLADPDVFTRAAQDLARGWGISPVTGRIPWFWDRVEISRGDRIAGVRDGETIQAAARRLRRDPAGLVLDLCRVGGHRVQVVLHYRTEEDMQAFLGADFTTMGSDGSAVPYEVDRHPHPRFFGATARTLGRYTRDLELFSWARAVHKMSGAVADRLRLTDRGTVRAGLAADLVVLDPDQVNDRATFAEPKQAPVGIDHVIVNGVHVVADGQQTEDRPGRVLRHQSRKDQP